ncbi:hypothetical protein [Paraburkholderia caffeinilytica]|jgi:hypothetical protein|uniref:Uncharacterized protein n=1 Tax=Paraburkholderia caffeinilytica TaxID=1761016 RepID=A0ABQ1M318_9BURK|nr:hypothetical protein [Paraburkholderia caffeinilytica]GGC32294.1 hypothetical protein GCM10011400_18680 [Paraburkholderia caffeinilytica]CAB3796545.1 hypothetical protein LMG28690_04356 [Paraburkholderia caffeinilytica]
MAQKNAAKSTLGACVDLPLEARLAEAGGAGRDEISARLTHEIGCLNSALPGASPVLRNEMTLLVECLRAARQVVERSANFANASDNLKESKS